MKDVEVNKNPQRPDGNGIVPDTLGFISRDLKVVQFLQQNQVDATFKQTIKVYGAVAQEYRTALTVNNVYRATNAGVTVTGTTVVPSARPK